MFIQKSGDIAEPQICSSATSAIDRIHGDCLRRAKPVVDDVEAALRKRGIFFHEETPPCPELFDTPVIKIVPENGNAELPCIEIVADNDPMLLFGGKIYDNPRASLGEIIDEICNCCAANGVQLSTPLMPKPQKTGLWSKFLRKNVR